MWSERSIRFWISGLAAISLGGMAWISVCRDSSSIAGRLSERDMPECEAQISRWKKPAEKEKNTKEGREKESAERWAEICLDLYVAAENGQKENDPETIRSIVNRFGERGYPAVDSGNQMDMAEADQMVRFCEAACAGKEAEVILAEVSGSGFEIYELRAEAGKGEGKAEKVAVKVTRSRYEYKNRKIRQVFQGSYQAEDFRYTEDGYVMFSGVWFSEADYVLTCSEAREYKAFRVQPLDEMCRKLNREYIMPVGYRYNNMFLTDWQEGEFGNLNFYDLFDLFYLRRNARPVPYEDGSMIPKDVFESVLMAYFCMDSATLQEEAVYCAEEGGYLYRPRDFTEAEYPAWPYPEVVEYTENGDGTMTLLVHAVFPYGGNSRVYAHEVVVRPLEEGGVQYVSNRVIPSKKNSEITWHTSRSTGNGW